MRLRALRILAFALATLALCDCGAASSSGRTSSGPSPQQVARLLSTTRAAGPALTDWPEFGLDAQRSNATSRPTGITAANIGRLRAQRISLPGTVDSSPVYVHGVSVGGRTRDVIVLTTSYGRTIAIDAGTGALLWTFTPRGYASWAGSAQITNTSPIVDPDHAFLYAASPNGLIHKLALATGREDGSGAWPVSVTRDAKREKLGAALNIDGPDVLVATSGYLGDAPAYVGHLVLLSRASGAITGVFNALCADRRVIISPKSCAQSDAAILSRGGAVVEPSGRLLLDTGNGAWNGSTDFGDSVLELTFPALTLRQAFTPTDQQRLSASDLDLGSSAPVLLGHERVLVAGKDGIMRVLDLERLDGRAPSAGRELGGGEVQTLPTPGGGQLFTAPAVWRHGSRTTLFVADSEGTASYAVSAGRVHQLWKNSTPGASPIFAGGLLYVYDPSAGGIEVYAPGSPRAIARLAGKPGHWNSPIVLAGHVVEPEGDANSHSQSGSLVLFTIR